MRMSLEVGPFDVLTVTPMEKCISKDMPNPEPVLFLQNVDLSKHIHV